MLFILVAVYPLVKKAIYSQPIVEKIYYSSLSKLEKKIENFQSLPENEIEMPFEGEFGSILWKECRNNSRAFWMVLVPLIFFFFLLFGGAALCIIKGIAVAQSTGKNQSHILSISLMWAGLILTLLTPKIWMQVFGIVLILLSLGTNEGFKKLLVKIRSSSLGRLFWSFIRLPLWLFVISIFVIYGFIPFGLGRFLANLVLPALENATGIRFGQVSAWIDPLLFAYGVTLSASTVGYSFQRIVIQKQCIRSSH